MNIQSSNMQTIILVLLVILISIICAALFFTNKEVRNLKNSVSKNYHDIAAIHSLLEKQSKECLQEEVPMCPLPPDMNPYQTNVLSDVLPNVLPSVPEGMEPLQESVPVSLEDNQEDEDVEIIEVSTNKQNSKESEESSSESSDEESEDSDESEQES